MAKGNRPSASLKAPKGSSGGGEKISQKRFLNAYSSYIQELSPNKPADKIKIMAQVAYDTIMSRGATMYDAVPEGYSKTAIQTSPVGVGLHRENKSLFGKEKPKYAAVLASGLLSKLRK